MQIVESCNSYDQSYQKLPCKYLWVRPMFSQDTYQIFQYSQANATRLILSVDCTCIGAL